MNTNIIMSEMLGNQYFMARKYDKALTAFEECVQKEKSNSEILKKMVVCYIQVGEIKRAAELLKQIISNDLDLILNTDPIEEDCPCNELAFSLEANYNVSLKSFDYLSALGVLWLYCDMNKSIDYFKEALQLKPNDKVVNSILRILLYRKEQTSKQINNYPS